MVESTETRSSAAPVTRSGLAVFPSGPEALIAPVPLPSVASTAPSTVAPITARHRGVSGRPSGKSCSTRTIASTNIVSSALEASQYAAVPPGRSPDRTTSAYVA